VVLVEHYFGPAGERKIRRSMVAVRKSELPPNSTIWISDATADAEEIRALAGRPVQNMTPDGRLAGRHPVVQIPCDVTQGTAPHKIINVLRGVALSLAGYKRLGVITHKKHADLIRGEASEGPELEEAVRRRIAMVEHFRGGQSRGSNDWIKKCDALVVMGTPRVPPSAVRKHLIRLGKSSVAARTLDKKADWGTDYWSGVTTSGRRVTIRSRGYRDHDYHAAHRHFVASELLQCIGRARSVCKHGIPVFVLTTESLGVPVSDFPFAPLTDSEWEILQAMAVLHHESAPLRPASEDESLRALSMGEEKQPSSSGQLIKPFPKGYTIGNGLIRLQPLRSATITDRVGKSQQYVIRLLKTMAGRGLVERIGKRGGWKMVVSIDFLPPVS
jgi:hypothetical protein